MSRFNRLSRRHFLLGAGTVAFMSPSLAGGQSPNESGADQAEWWQSYDEATSLRIGRPTIPLLSVETIAATEAALARFAALVGSGGWPQMPNAPLKLGMKDDAVVALRKRLMASGDLDGASGLSTVFDSFVEAGVQRFQELHGLRPTGIVNGQTITALNIPAEIRLRQLEVNLVRLRSYATNPGRR